jgi:sugar (pentulose or hexulose) kinase
MAGPLDENGSAIMPGAAHLARQLLYLETEWPEKVAAARWFLGGPQFWGWLFSGVGASELTYLGAQTHLYDVRNRRFAAIVANRNWQRLMAPVTPAWRRLGPLKADLVRRFDLPDGIGVLCGVHDSSANFYRYQQAGLADLALISTGTWIVGLADIARPAAFTVTEQRICNADVLGRPLAGVLTMGGREFTILLGDVPEGAADPRRIAGLVEAGTMALPSFAEQDAVFPGTAGKGRIVGPPPGDLDDRRALAVLYSALCTDVCLDVMGENAITVLDGSFVKDPLYAALVAALRPGKRTLYGSDAYGTAAGAGLLADHETRTAPAPIDTTLPEPLRIPGLGAYRDAWRRLAGPAGIGNR